MKRNKIIILISTATIAVVVAGGIVGFAIHSSAKRSEAQKQQRLAERQAQEQAEEIAENQANELIARTKWLNSEVRKLTEQTYGSQLQDFELVYKSADKYKATILLGLNQPYTADVTVMETYVTNNAFGNPATPEYHMPPLTIVTNPKVFVTNLIATNPQSSIALSKVASTLFSQANLNSNQSDEGTNEIPPEVDVWQFQIHSMIKSQLPKWAFFGIQKIHFANDGEHKYKAVIKAQVEVRLELEVTYSGQKIDKGKMFIA